MLLFIETAALLCHNNYRFLHTNWCLSFILLFFEMHFVNAGDVVRSLFLFGLSGNPSVDKINGKKGKR